MPNNRNLDALTQSVMAALGDPDWSPGLPTVRPALSIDARSVAQQLADDGALNADALTNADTGKVFEVCRQHQQQQVGPDQLKVVLRQIARGE